MRKEDVEFHSDYGREARPAVNVKVYRWQPLDVREIAREEGADEATADAFAEWWEEHEDDERLHASLWEFATEDAWELLQEDAREYAFEDRSVKVWAEGRSGGWAVVDGLPDFDLWDAIDLMRWSRFAKAARSLADDVPASMVRLAYMNQFEAQRSRELERLSR